MTVRINELLDYIRNGRVMDAMNEFYADDVVMTEPAYGATEGLAANLTREQQFVDSVAEFKAFETPTVAIDGTHPCTRTSWSGAAATARTTTSNRSSSQSGTNKERLPTSDSITIGEHNPRPECATAHLVGHDTRHNLPAPPCHHSPARNAIHTPTGSRMMAWLPSADS